MPDEESLTDAAAFGRLYQQQGASIRRFLCLAVRDRFAADDLTQETFLHLWRRPAAFNPESGCIKAYLLGIARKKAADWWRHNRSRLPEVPATARAETEPVAIRQALEQLPEDLRTVLWLREVEGYSYDELAKILKIPAGTVRSRLHSARQQLRKIWMEESDDLPRG
ncbi:MAG TPA: RNA polymerase sigma factor [Bryobacteraceae bacterium]|nr:RNA polymerase sigma factor [Bryobacteraceae bacterium]